jgi:hypothetical protein
MNACAVIATHHKTGTVWMRTVFQRLSRLLGIRFVMLDRKSDPALRRFRTPVVVMDDHAEFNNCKWILERRSTRLFHLIRDPRDVIISAAHYHCSARESWLHRRREKFDGQSYQHTIRHLRTDRERYIFEMDNSAGLVIAAMQNWDYGMPNAMEGQYEQLIADDEGVLFGQVLEHLGFEPSEVQCGREQFLLGSIIGAGPAKPAHVRSGMPRQWEQIFDHGLAVLFLQKFGDVLLKLGYEKDAAWAENLPERSPEFDAANEWRLGDVAKRTRSLPEPSLG